MPEAPVKEPEIKPGRIDPGPDLDPERLCPKQKETITKIIRRNI